MERKFASEETKQLLFSVIMPVYNVEKYVSQAIESVLHQEFIDFELIIVNDCSPDGSLAICKKYAEKDHRITIISLDKNGGLSNARNVGMSAMRGRYVLFLDSDDWWDEDLLQSVADVIEQDEPDIVFFGYRDEWFSMDDRRLQTSTRTFAKAISTKSNNHLEVLRRSIILQAQDNDMYSWSANKAIKNKKKPSRFIDVPLSEDKEYIGRLWENASSLSVTAKPLLLSVVQKAGRVGGVRHQAPFSNS
ncbi:MAG: glycosyltransferase family 2 protein [Dialister invisus]